METTVTPYLIAFNSHHLPEEETPVLVVGSGAAGLAAALAAAKKKSVMLVTKSGLLDSASDIAQGGVAAALAPGDSPEQHLQDTVAAAAGLAEPEAVRVLVEEGPLRIKELIAAGACFARQGKGLAFTREGGHSFARILFAAGDQTGAEVVRTLFGLVIQNRRITLRERLFLVDLFSVGGEVSGGIFYDREKRSLFLIRAGATILATGGAGQLFQETTNPAIATADGLAAAFRAGAVLRDLEFVQFHPTVFYLAGAPRFLVSEAVRGEGAVLIDDEGKRFMPEYHPAAELAPRDVVARAILDRMKKRQINCVYLDCRSLGVRFRKRFPTIYATVRSFRIDPVKQPIPVRPAAHYLMGGIKTDLDGCTGLNGLLACGEVSSSGVHGANRLGSNSLLECLVFGYRAGEKATSGCKINRRHLTFSRRGGLFSLDTADLHRSLATLMWRQVGVERIGTGLELALKKFEEWQRYVLPLQATDPSGWEVQNSLLVANLMVKSALHRTESRGSHWRVDFPNRADRHWLRHIEHQRSHTK